MFGFFIMAAVGRQQGVEGRRDDGRVQNYMTVPRNPGACEFARVRFFGKS
jgi:hypothetical protein